MQCQKKINNYMIGEDVRRRECRIVKAVLCFLMMWGVAPVGVSGLTAAEIKVFDFFSDPVGAQPAGWRSATGGFSQQSGQWQVTVADVPPLFEGENKDPLVLQSIQSRVIAQTGQVTAQEHFPMLVHEGSLCRNFSLSLKFKILSGEVSQMAGICFRFVDENNYYVIRASAKDATLRFYKYFQGLRGDPIGPKVQIPVGEWVDLKVEAKGAEFQAWLDGKQAFPEPVTDYAFDKGLVGVWTKSDSITYFHGMKLDYTPLLTMGQRLVNMAGKKFSDLSEITLYAIQPGGVDTPIVIASNLGEKVGTFGDNVTRDVIENKNTYRARARDRTTTMTVPVEDRNGEPVAALKIVYKGFRGETETTSKVKALTVARFINDNLGVATLSDR